MRAQRGQRDARDHVRAWGRFRARTVRRRYSTSDHERGKDGDDSARARWIVSALEVERIARALATRAYGRSLVVLDETESTNDDARRAAAQGAARGHVVVADAQRRGRGAHGRSWSSPGGTDLYLSIVERLAIEPARIAPLTLAVGLGVSDAVQALAPGLEAKVKWPNDVWISGRKCAGILCEASSSAGAIEAIVIGIGLGVNRASFEGELASSATSLAIETGGPLDRERALATLLGCVEPWVDRFASLGAAPIVEALRPRLALRGERVRIDDEQGTLLDVAATGAIRIETDRGVRERIAGTLRRA